MLLEEFLKIFFNSLFEKRDSEITLKNSPLVSMEVKKKIDYKRYTLLVNKKEILCVSYKPLEVGQNYWSIISVDKHGIITLSNLSKQPDFFQNNSFFSFGISFDKIKENLRAKDGLSYYKEILNKEKNLDTQKIKNLLFCADNGILSYPLFFNNERMLLQFKIINQNLNEKRVQYYFGFKNFGCFGGTVNENGNITISSKYHHIVDKIIDKEIIFKKEGIVRPLCNISKSILDLKG